MFSLDLIIIGNVDPDLIEIQYQSGIVLCRVPVSFTQLDNHDKLQFFREKYPEHNLVYKFKLVDGVIVAYCHKMIQYLDNYWELYQTGKPGSLTIGLIKSYGFEFIEEESVREVSAQAMELFENDTNRIVRIMQHDGSAIGTYGLATLLGNRLYKLLNNYHFLNDVMEFELFNTIDHHKIISAIHKPGMIRRKSTMLIAKKKDFEISQIDKSLHGKKKFMSWIIKLWPRIYNKLPEKVRSIKQVALSAICSDFSVIARLSEKLSDDIQFVKRLVELKHDELIDYIKQQCNFVRNKNVSAKDVVALNILKNCSIIRPDIVNYCIPQDNMHLGNQVFKVILKANPNVYDHLPRKLKRDKKIKDFMSTVKI